MMVRLHRLVLATMLGLVIASGAVTARGADKASAEALFQQAKDLMEAGRLDEACPKFQASYEADPAIGALLNLALCHQKQGKTASAWAEFTAAAAMAKRAGDATRAQGAADLARDLKPKLSRLTITAAEPIPGLEVTRNGEPMAQGSLGTPLPVDPGDQEIVATAPDHQRWSTTVTVEPDGDQQQIRIPALEPASAEGTGAVTSNDGRSAQSIAGWVLTGIGGASILVAAILGGVASGDVSDARDDPALCPDEVCTEAGREQIDSAEALANGSTAMFVIGGAFVVGGVVLLLTSDSDDEPARESAWILPAVGPTGAGLTITGTF